MLGNKINKFFSKVVVQQMKTAGSPFKVVRKRENREYNIRGILTTKNGDSFAVVGGIQHIISAHILIEKTDDYIPAVGDRVLTSGTAYQIVGYISSPDDKAFSCDLIQLSR